MIWLVQFMPSPYRTEWEKVDRYTTEQSAREAAGRWAVMHIGDAIRIIVQTED